MIFKIIQIQLLTSGYSKDFQNFKVILKEQAKTFIF